MGLDGCGLDALALYQLGAEYAGEEGSGAGVVHDLIGGPLVQGAQNAVLGDEDAVAVHVDDDGLADPAAKRAGGDARRL